MAAINDYVCMAHGAFTNRTGICPHGCGRSMSHVVFNKPVGMVSGRTKGIDGTLATLAKDHGLSDMNNHNGTTGAFIPDPGYTRAQREMQEAMMRGQTYAGEMASGANAIQSTLTQGNFKADNALTNDVVRQSITPPKVIVHASDGKKALTKEALK
jgi:hypothetical protein